jgi:cell division protein YceG involved in septum cleavage
VSELQNPSPYNTRVHPGLPPGPIGNPGLASIRAAAHPARTGFLFYVVKPSTCGKHNFAKTDAEFQGYVNEYNRARDKNGGKSPTTC